MVSNEGGSSPGATPSFQDLTNTYILSSTPTSKQSLVEVPKALAVDPSRQRRPHRKSRAGCENCRKRRVKCNDRTPCGNCDRRGEHCQRLIRRSVVTSMPSEALVTSSKPTDTSVNFLHLKLFHHFETYTRQTLLLPPRVWEHTLQLCFEFDFLMNTILCVSARHLAVLRPEDETYPTTAASHLCRALTRFRQELSNSLTSVNMDAFIATSTLLQYEVWTRTDFCTSQGDGGISFDPSKDNIFALSSGLKQVFLSIPQDSTQSSIILPYMQHDPRDMLSEAAQISDATNADYQNWFSYHRPIHPGLLNFPFPRNQSNDLAVSSSSPHLAFSAQYQPRSIEDSYTIVIERVCLVLSFLPQAQQLNTVSKDSNLLSELARYIFSFPILCHGPFASMIQQSDPHAILVLFHFYRAVRMLLPSDKYWWAHRRAIMSEVVLNDWLTRWSIDYNGNE